MSDCPEQRLRKHKRDKLPFSPVDDNVRNALHCSRSGCPRDSLSCHSFRRCRIHALREAGGAMPFQHVNHVPHWRRKGCDCWHACAVAFRLEKWGDGGGKGDIAQRQPVSAQEGPSVRQPAADCRKQGPDPRSCRVGTRGLELKQGGEQPAQSRVDFWRQPRFGGREGAWKMGVIRSRSASRWK